MNIKEVEKITAFSKPNIRYYEDMGLINPARDANNNYRVYSQEDVDRLLEVKKLRLLGVSIEDIHKLFDGSKTLQSVMEKRLSQIENEAGLLKKQAEILRQSISSNVEDVEGIELNEKSETWQRQLAILLRDDIVAHKLSRSEFNRDVMMAYLFGCVAAIATSVVLMLVGNSIEEWAPMSLAMFACIIVCGIAPIWSGNAKVHIVSLAVSAALSAGAMWGVLANGINGNIPGTGYLHHTGITSGGVAARVMIIIYVGLAVLAVVAWAISQVSPSAFKSVLTAMVLSALYAFCVYFVTSRIYGECFGMYESVEIVLIGLLFAVILTVQWCEINAEKVKFTRYNAFVLANKMTNVVFTFISARGYYGGTNVRRG